jgi:hypothetical protein
MTACALIVTVAQLTSCEKVGDIFKGPNGAEIKNCNIKKITTLYNAKQYVYEFQYNAQGDPIRINSNAQSLGLNSLIFKYDNKKRLSYYYEETSAPSFDFQFLHRFTYDGQKRAIADSVFAGGSFNALNNGDYAPIEIYYFEYDQYNRVKKVAAVSYPGSPAEVTNYTNYAYDNKGNLIKDPAVTYDNKTSLRRTNSIWMFLARDYSLNNGFTALQYNQHGLPLAGLFENSPYNWGPMFYPVLMLDSKIEYECQ